MHYTQMGKCILIGKLSLLAYRPRKPRPGPLRRHLLRHLRPASGCEAEGAGARKARSESGLASGHTLLLMWLLSLSRPPLLSCLSKCLGDVTLMQRPLSCSRFSTSDLLLYCKIPGVVFPCFFFQFDYNWGTNRHKLGAS